MMNNMPAGQGPPGPPQYHGRRHQNQYYMPPNPHEPYGYHNPAVYHHAAYHPSQPWYQPYYPVYQPQPHYQQQHPPHRPYHPQAPLVVGHAHAPPFVPASRLPQIVPQPNRTPLQDPLTPSSASQNIISPSTTPTVASADAPNASASTPPTHAPVVNAPPTPPPAPQPTVRMGFWPTKLPWYSVEESSWPKRKPKRLVKTRFSAEAGPSLTLPAGQSSTSDDPSTIAPSSQPTAHTNLPTAEAVTESTVESIEPVGSLQDDPVDNQTEEKAAQAQETPVQSESTAAPAQTQQSQLPPQPVVKPTVKPVVPIIPVVPKVKPTAVTAPAQPVAPVAAPEKDVQEAQQAVVTPTLVDGPVAPQEETVRVTPEPSEAPRPVAKSWAAILGSNAAPKIANANRPLNGAPVNGAVPAKAASLADALRNYEVDQKHLVHFLEPRGLINTGNMCYMNSVLQVLIFCTPFYEFLDDVSKRAVHSFKSDTPLIDAMIMFMREYNIIDTAKTPEQLRTKLKALELKQDGASFAPEHIYEVIKQLPRFSTMRRGHQQDAEEFLGFLLDGLHEECASIIRKASPDILSSFSDAASDVASTIGSGDAKAEDGWQEVGPKQKASTTQSSGELAIESPITKIFGGKLRSEFKVPGQKQSITLEPYQPLQLDIGSPEISNITQALKGLTKSETISGKWETPRGPASSAQKQVFVETVPPVLILHLKRFQYDNTTGSTQKIWKKIGYPLELELPKEVFAPNKRAQLGLRPGGLPKYRLISVVYHHGKSATGGHYTADLRRQDGRSWVRFDDTVITRPTSEEVANEGGEEDPKILAAALESHKRNDSASAVNNIYQGFEQDGSNEITDDDQGWSTVNGHSPTSNRKWSSVANSNGTATPNTGGKATPRPSDKFFVKDNKVAYILFYERISD